MNVSTPARDQRKKRVRKNIKLGDFSSIKGIKDNSGSSEEEHSEEATNEVKKPRLLGGERSETHEEEDVRGDKDNTEGLEEEGGILKVLLDMHEVVPLEDPGPASVDRAEGAAGATQ